MTTPPPAGYGAANQTPVSAGASGNNTNFALAPGETGVYGDTFLASLVAPYLKAQLMCSTTRFVFKAPNTLFGIIPVGSNENTIPLRNVASVTSNVAFRFGRFILGLILAIAGLAVIGDSPFGGFILLALGIIGILGSFPTALQVQNPAGGTTTIEVSPLEKAKLQTFIQELQNRVFADQSQVQHHEAQALRTQQLMMQQLSLQQQMSSQQQAAAFGMANMAQQQALHGQQPGAQIPPASPEAQHPGPQIPAAAPVAQQPAPTQPMPPAGEVPPQA